jgi:nucleoside-diphosphate-sugar epimerase
MTKPCLGITGTGGFTGAALLLYFRSSGYRTVSFSRSNPAAFKNDNNRHYSFDKIPDKNLLQDIDILIHCAYSNDITASDGHDINFIAARNLFNAAMEAGVKKIIFFSSKAASENTGSAYGKSKAAIESLLDPSKHVILRCGLIIGDGGLFKKMSGFALRRKIVPLINRGRQPVQYAGIDDIKKGVENCINNELTGFFSLASAEAVTYREFFQQVSRAAGKRLFYILLPGWFIKLIIGVSEKLNIHLPVNKTNLAGLNAMKFISSKSDLEKLGISIRPLNEILSSFFSERKS